MSIKKTIIILITVLFVVLVSIITVRTLCMPDRQVKEIPAAVKVSLNQNQAANRLAGAIKCKTVSYGETEKFDYSQFIKLHEYYETAFPNVHKKLIVEKINTYSLLYTWEGSDKSIKPIILTAHLDVADVEKQTLSQWRHEPFSGEIAEGKIWGRGARDNKCQVTAILEAVEYLIQKGFQPKRTIYLAFGHDEEVLGLNGAKRIADLLKLRNIVPECVVDEGGAVAENVIPGLKGKVALISIAEKGYLTLELSVNEKAGHSAEPEDETTIGILSNAIVKLEMDKFSPTMNEAEPILTYAASDMKFPYNVVFSNLWFTKGVVKKMFLSDSETAAMLRTTVAPTIIESGYQDNCIPGTAKAIINLRLLPGDTVENAIESIREKIGDSRIKIKKVGFYNNAPKSAPLDTEGFKTVSIAIKQVFPDAVCVPFFTTGGTDAKHYAALTPNLYRFTPSIKEKDEEGHGINERIPIGNYMQYIDFFVNLIRDFQNVEKSSERDKKPA